MHDTAKLFSEVNPHTWEARMTQRHKKLYCVVTITREIRYRTDNEVTYRVRSAHMVKVKGEECIKSTRSLGTKPTFAEALTLADKYHEPEEGLMA